MGKFLSACLFFAEGGIEQVVEYVAQNKEISVKEKKTFLETLKEIVNKIVDIVKNYVTNNHLKASEKAVGDMSLDDIKKLRTQFLDVIDGAIANLENGVEVGNGKKNSVNIKNAITVDMSEEDRAKVLKDTNITLTDDIVSSKDINVNDYDDIKSRIEKPLRAKLDKLGVFKKYKSNAINIDFEFTHGGFSKSIHSQKEYGGSNADFASVATNLDMLLDNAVLIETHTDKGKGTLKEKRTVKHFYVLISALKQGSTITPVQFEIEEYINDDNRLYLAVAMTKINEADVVESVVDGKADIEHSLLSAPTVSIVDIFKKINPKDKNFLKYIPDEFLNTEQKEAKASALDIEAEKYGKKGSGENANKNTSVKFSLDVPVEETKDLIAVHNISEEKLMKSLQLGGLPMPSIAVMKAKEAKGNSVYGNISLVFPKSQLTHL